MDVIEHQLLARQLAAFGVDLPIEARHALDVYAAAQEAANANPSADLRAAFEAGRLTPKNTAAAVREAALAQNAQGAAHSLAADLARPVSKAATRAIAADGDRIVTELRPAFADAASAVRRAAETFAPDADPAQVLASSPVAAEVWQQLADARRPSTQSAASAPDWCSAATATRRPSSPRSSRTRPSHRVPGG